MSALGRKSVSDRVVKLIIKIRIRRMWLEFLAFACEIYDAYMRRL